MKINEYLKSGCDLKYNRRFFININPQIEVMTLIRVNPDEIGNIANKKMSTNPERVEYAIQGSNKC